MTDAAPKVKKAGPSTGGDTDGKKRFEVKKVYIHALRHTYNQTCGSSTKILY